MSTRYRGRLAPSPTGALHLGNARTFMIAWLRARSCGGQIIMRIEDLDHPKNKSGAAQEALADLRWLGFDWDEGPDVGGQAGPYVQSQRRTLYRAARDRLLKKDLIYPCVCSRKDVEAAQSAPHAEETLFYDGRCRGRFKTFEEARESCGRLPAWRFKTEQGQETRFCDNFCGTYSQDVGAFCGDFVVARDIDGAGYMLAAALDDALMGITEVVRGDDLLSVTPRQLLLFKALELTPPQFLHLPLVKGVDGLRLAKRHGDTRIAAFRQSGCTPQQVIGLLAHWSGLAEKDEALSLSDLTQRFELNAIAREAVTWNPAAVSFFADPALANPL